MREAKSGPGPDELVRPEVRRLRAYTLDQPEVRWRLDQNELPWDLPRRLKTRALARLAAEPFNLYPDANAAEIRGAVGRLNEWPADGVLLGGGSSELLSLSIEAFCRPGGEVVGHAPSFSLYPMLVPRSGGVPLVVLSGADLEIPFAGLLAEVERDPTRPLIVCTPNNPTGHALRPEQVARLLDGLSAPLLLDNAYHEFCRHDYRPLLERYRHLVLYRTLSKAWSVAGIRLGYLLADPALVAELVKVKLPYNLGHPQIAIAREALAAPGVARRRIAVMLGRRRQWRELFEAAGCEVFPSEANFLLVRAAAGAGAAEEAAGLRRRLADGGILVRDLAGYPGLAGCVRVGLGDGRALRAARRALAGWERLLSEDRR